MGVIKNDSDSGGIDRRGFFRSLAAWSIEQAEQVGKTVVGPLSVDGSDQAAPADGTPAEVGGQASTRFLRPPGALDELDFADTCSRCGLCVSACPAKCIQLDVKGTEEQESIRADGLPFIVARESPCVVCDDLSCMKACPTGALKLVDRAQIHMGIAVVDTATCLRAKPDDLPIGPGGQPSDDTQSAHSDSPDCRLCIQDCPFGETAIGVATDNQIEVRDGCVGCGVCERVCPTEPPSIVIHLI